MQFRTEIKAKPYKHQLSYNDAVLFIGSCFSVNIHKKLQQLKFNTISNPFGIVYNPISLTKQLNRILTNLPYAKSELHYYNEQWLSLDHHSDFSSTNQDECLAQINNEIAGALDQIKSAKFIFITLGSSWVYRWNENNNVVSNCHKIPSKEFTKQLADVDFMINQMTSTMNAIKKVNPQVQFVFSVSPVRHLGDGHFENQVSKGRLFDLIYQIQNQFENAHYFSAYELLLDDLRDYRFYKDDLIHPSENAITYIWEYFSKAFFSDQTASTISKVEKVISAVNHRPFNPKSEAHQKFISKTLSQIKTLQDLVSGDFNSEVQILKSNE